MPNYRRTRVAGSCYFFTVVTRDRRRLLQPPRIDLLRQVVREVKIRLPFKVDAWVVLPDHMHAIWRLPQGDADFSKRWGLIKSGFSKRFGSTTDTGARRDPGLWQPRFWEHLIRDEADWRAHMDYVHYNPVKHGLVTRVRDWPHSSFHRLVEKGYYDLDWGVADGDMCGRNFGE